MLFSDEGSSYQRTFMHPTVYFSIGPMWNNHQGIKTYPQALCVLSDRLTTVCDVTVSRMESCIYIFPLLAPAAPFPIPHIMCC